jgi:hypothetical protein
MNGRGRLQSLRIPFLFFGAISLLGPATWAASGPRTTILVPVPASPSWKDMVFLAAVPAATVANDGSPSVIAVEESLAIGPEIQDYARRYRPDRVVLIAGEPGDVALGEREARTIQANSAEEASLALSGTYWTTSRTAVICSEEDYASALVAAPLASLLKSPLLFAQRRGLSKATIKELERLRVRELIAVGLSSSRLRDTSWKVTALQGGLDVAAWARRRGLKVRYLAVVNPTDRTRTVIGKLSLAGALLAAGRGGLVAPLAYDVRWKFPGTDAPLEGELPSGVPKSAAPPKSGSVELDGETYPYFLTGEPDERNLRLSIDANRDGEYGQASEGPFASGDTVQLGQKTCAISLGTRTSFGKTDVHLTWPTAEQLCGDLRAFYRALGAPPDHLCLVGFPDAIPQAIVGHGAVVEEQASDLPYSNADEDPFAEVGVGRVIAENVSFATLYASRVLTYRDLLSPDWQNRACAAEWETTYKGLFEDAGFDAGYVHTSADLGWAVAPTDENPGVRAQSFSQDSPLASCAAITHGSHAWWRGLGSTFSWDATVLTAPAIVESGGCGTACIDREPEYRSVVARLFRQGAVAFCGATRENPAEGEPERQEFWNGILAGASIGQAHRRAANSALLVVLDNNEGPGGIYRYSLNIHTQFGDPALVMHVAAKPRSQPAHVAVHGDKVSVYAPERWWPVKFTPPPDWKKWAGKELYVVRGVGAYALSDWCQEGYNLEQMYVTAEFTSRRRVSRIEQVQTPPAPLGWRGTWYCDPNPDGSYTYRWAVRLIDFDQLTGRIINSVDHIDYKVSYE